MRYPLPHQCLYVIDQEKYLYGCDSLESLFNYFSKQKVDINNCILQIYDIPQKKIINMEDGQVKFLKKDIE